MFVQCINNACGEQHDRQKCQGRSKLVEGGIWPKCIDIQYVVSRRGWGHALPRKILEARRALLRPFLGLNSNMSYKKNLN